MRDRDTIDSDLRSLAALRCSIRERGGELLSRQVDELLDERLGHPPETSETERDEIDDITPYARKGVRRLFKLLPALTLSLLAVAVLVVMFVIQHPHPATQPVVPPSSAPSRPSPSALRSSPAAPKVFAPPLDITDRAFVDTLKQEGVPVPSNEYVMSHGHAVCDFVAHQPDFPVAIRSVQESSIWDADQSTQFAAGAIAAYCPQYDHARSDEMQRTLQKVLSELQAIDGNLHSIRDALPAIAGGQ